MTNLIRIETNTGDRVVWSYGKHKLTYHQGLLIKDLKEHSGNATYSTSFGRQIITLSKKGLVSYHKRGHKYHPNVNKYVPDTYEYDVHLRK